MTPSVEVVGLRRAKISKTRSGCITCKARKVKCDEAKPHCRRCINYGSVCEGYASNFVPASRHTLSLLLPKPQSSSIRCAPTILVSNDSEERRYFYSFSQDTSRSLSGYFKSPFWTQIVLQAAHKDVSIMHALAAIGALTKAHPTLSPIFKRLDLEAVPQKQRNFALQQYGKAITTLRTTLSTNPDALQTALIACLLFICIESLQGNAVASVSQIGWGISLLARAQSSNTSSSKDVERALYLMFNNLTVECYLLCPGRSLPQFVQVFTSLDTKDILSSNIRLPEMPPVVLPSDTSVLIAEPPIIFNDVLAAKAALEILLQGTIQLREAYHGTDEEKIARYNWHLAILTRWNDAFTALVTELGSRAREETVLMLRAYYNVALILHISGTTEDEMAYDSCIQEFINVVDTAEDIFRNRLQPSGFEFSFEMGLVPPLYIVASKCRDPKVRRRAISLCRMLGGQEGMWHPGGLADLGDWIMSVEEEGWDGLSVVPAANRVRLSTMMCETEKSTLHVQLSRSPEYSHKNEERIITSFPTH